MNKKSPVEQVRKEVFGLLAKLMWDRITIELELRSQELAINMPSYAINHRSFALFAEILKLRGMFPNIEVNGYRPVLPNDAVSIPSGNYRQYVVDGWEIKVSTDDDAYDWTARNESFFLVVSEEVTLSQFPAEAKVELNIVSRHLGQILLEMAK